MENDKKIELLWDLVNHEGWTLIVEDLEEKIKILTEELTRREASPYQLGKAQGVIQIQREFVALKKILDTALKQAREETESEQADTE